MHQKSVKNQSGVRKLVTADTREELDEQVAAVRAERVFGTPDITDPKHANLTMEEFHELEAKDAK